MTVPAELAPQARRWPGRTALGAGILTLGTLANPLALRCGLDAVSGLSAARLDAVAGA